MKLIGLRVTPKLRTHRHFRKCGIVTAVDGDRLFITMQDGFACCNEPIDDWMTAVQADAEDQFTKTVYGDILQSLLEQYNRQRRALALASLQADALGDTDLHQLASEIATERGAEEPTVSDYIEAYILATERL
jgi:hypothetical protein